MPKNAMECATEYSSRFQFSPADISLLSFFEHHYSAERDFFTKNSISLFQSQANQHGPHQSGMRHCKYSFPLAADILKE
jgi:hypothetical protein